MLASLHNARRKFLETKRPLLVNRVHERTIGAHFADALRKFYPRFEVDPEYDRNLERSKYAVILGRMRRIVPDVVVHRWRTHDFNHLAIEIKRAGANNASIRKDRLKLRAMRRPPYSYPHTYLMFYSTGPEADIWFEEVT